MKDPSVFISILNWNGLEDTKECLESVFRMRYQNFHVVVLDNDSCDNSVVELRNLFPRVHLIENKTNTGFTGGNNTVIDYAIHNGADYLWMLNNDTVVEPDTLSSLVEMAESNASIGMVSPLIHCYGERRDKIQFMGSYIVDDHLAIADVTALQQLEDPHIRNKMILWGTALLVKREVINAIGYLDDIFFAYAEDCDYSIRVNNAGYVNAVCSNARVFHKDSRSTGGRTSPIQVFLRTRNLYVLKMRYLRRQKKLGFLMEYLAYCIETMAAWSAGGKQERSIDACLDGMWCAFRGIGGSYPNTHSMPSPLRKALLFFVNWHPFLWAGCLRADLSGVVSEVRRRLFARWTQAA